METLPLSMPLRQSQHFMTLVEMSLCRLMLHTMFYSLQYLILKNFPLSQMTAICQVRVNLATTCIFQQPIIQLHAYPALKELSLLQKIRPLALLAAPVFFLQSIGLLRRKHVNSALLARTAS